MMNRRGFLSASAAAATALGARPAHTGTAAAQAPPLPDATLYQKNEEAYWGELRKQFLIPADAVYLNNGTVGSSPWPVLQAVFDAYRDTSRTASTSKPATKY